MPRISGAKFLGNWKKLWTTARTLAKTKSPWKPNEREAFELFVAALVYQRNSLASFTEDALHASLRPGTTLLPSAALHRPDPLFEKFVPVGGEIGLAQLHLASASFRILTAFEVATGRTMTRREAQTHFGAIEGLKCCERGELGASLNEKLDHALVIMRIHRDDFGHGESGDPTDYGKGRKGVLSATHACRIIQAQQVVTESGLTQFTTI